MRSHHVKRWQPTVNTPLKTSSSCTGLLDRCCCSCCGCCASSRALRQCLMIIKATCCRGWPCFGGAPPSPAAPDHDEQVQRMWCRGGVQLLSHFDSLVVSDWQMSVLGTSTYLAASCLPDLPFLVVQVSSPVRSPVRHAEYLSKDFCRQRKSVIEWLVAEIFDVNISEGFMETFPVKGFAVAVQLAWQCHCSRVLQRKHTSGRSNLGNIYFPTPLLNSRRFR